MKTIHHLPEEEKKHYLQCHCGEYVDMRNLSDVFRHLHIESNIEPNWTYSMKVGEALAYTKSQKRIDLN
jgi:hypothetical protein